METRATYLAQRLGSVELSPNGKFEAGSYESFTLTFTAGEFGIDESGSLKLLMRLAVAARTFNTLVRTPTNTPDLIGD